MGVRQTYTENFDLIRTIEDRSKKLVAQELMKSHLYRRFIKSAQVVNCYDVKEVPLWLGPPTMGKWMARGDVLPDAQSSSAAQSFWTNRYIATPLGFDVMDLWENEGNPQALFDLIDFKTMESAVSQKRALSSAIFNGLGGSQPDGLGLILETAAPAAQTQTVGGVNKATKAWWRNQYVQLTSNFGTVAAGTNLPAGILALLQLIDACTIGTLVPSDIVTTKATFANIRRAMLEMSTPYHMITDRQDAQYGVRSFMFDGHWVSWDPNCPADEVYCLHIEEKFESERTGGQDDVKLDGDLEEVATDNILDLNGGLFMITNPNVRQRALAPRTPYRQLQQTQWMVDSFNLGVFRMSDHGVSDSSGGAMWETW